jgi:hypothetical protein
MTSFSKRGIESSLGFLFSCLYYRCMERYNLMYLSHEFESCIPFVLSWIKLILYT